MIQSIDVVHQRIHKKEFYDSQKRVLDIADDGTFSLLIEAQKKEMHLIIITDAEGKSHFDSYVDPTVTDKGTELTAFNRYIDGAPKATGTVYLNPTATANGTQRFEKLILGGLGPNSTGATGGESRVESILDPGHSLLIVVTNVSGQTKDYGVTVEWYEAVEH